MRGARWRSAPRSSSRASRRRSRPSPAPAARPRSRPSPARSGPRSGKQAASIGTIGLVSPKREVYGSLTTPDPVALHRSLDELAGEGVTHLAIEASSHGLDQHRLDGVRVAAGGFTNLSRDHLDYHPTLEAYLAAKLRLFSDLIVPGGAAVIVADHEHAAQVIAAAKQRGLRLFTVGRRATASGCWIPRSTASRKASGRVCGPRVHRPAAAGRRVPGRERAGRGGLCDRDRRRARRGVRGARTSQGRARGGSIWSASATARRSSSTTRTSPTRSPRRSKRCGPMSPAGSSWCSAAAATAIPASGR